MQVVVAPTTPSVYEDRFASDVTFGGLEMNVQNNRTYVMLKSHGTRERCFLENISLRIGEQLK